MADIHELEAESIEYTSTEDLAAIKLYDSTVEIIGFVESIESTKIVGVEKHMIFKFCLSNGMGDRVQVVVWNKEIKRIEPLIHINYIVHLDGAYSKPQVHRNFNKGTVVYVLTVQSNTIVNILGKQNIESNPDTTSDLEVVEIENVSQFTKCIKVQGYIKSNFGMIEKQFGKSNEFKCGSITDGVWKLEIHIPVTANTSDERDEFDFEKGDHIQAIGFVQINANPIHLMVKTMKDIKKIDTKKMNLKQLLRGTKQVERVHEIEQETSMKKQRLTN